MHPTDGRFCHTINKSESDESPLPLNLAPPHDCHQADTGASTGLPPCLALLLPSVRNLLSSRTGTPCGCSAVTIQSSCRNSRSLRTGTECSGCIPMGRGVCVCVAPPPASHVGMGANSAEMSSLNPGRQAVCPRVRPGLPRGPPPQLLSTPLTRGLTHTGRPGRSTRRAALLARARARTPTSPAPRLARVGCRREG